MSGSRSIAVCLDDPASLPHPTTAEEQNRIISVRASAVGISVPVSLQPSPAQLEGGGIIAENQNAPSNNSLKQSILTGLIWTGAAGSAGLLSLYGVLGPVGITSPKDIAKFPEAFENASLKDKVTACFLGVTTVGTQTWFNQGVIGESYRIIKGSYKNCKTTSDLIINTGKQFTFGAIAGCGAMSLATTAFSSFIVMPVIGFLLAPLTASLTWSYFTSSRFNGIHKLIKRIQHSLSKAARLQDKVENKFDRILPEYIGHIEEFLKNRAIEHPNEPAEDTLYALCQELENMAEKNNIFSDESKLYAFVKVFVSSLLAINAVLSVSPTFLAKSEAGFNLLSGDKLADINIWFRRALALLPTIISDIFIGLSNYDALSAGVNAIKNVAATPDRGKKIKKMMGLLSLIGINFAGSFGFKNITQGVVEMPESVVSDLPGMDGGKGWLANILPDDALISVFVVNAKTSVNLLYPKPEEPLPIKTADKPVVLKPDGNGSVVFEVSGFDNIKAQAKWGGLFTKPTPTKQKLKHGEIKNSEEAKLLIKSEEFKRENMVSNLSDLRIFTTKNPHKLDNVADERKPLLNHSVMLP